MKLKPKTSRRLLILAAGTLGIAVSVGGLFYFRTMRKEQTALAARDEGLRLVEKGEFYPALGKLANFLESPNGQRDREAMIAYAKARENTEEPDGRHVVEAISVYQKAWALDRTDRETGIHLLDLCNTAGMFPEAREIAEKLRPAKLEDCKEEHFEVLRQEANARIGGNPTDPQIEPLLRQLLVLRPADFPTQVVLVEHLRERGRTSDAMQFAEKLDTGDSLDRKAQARLLNALARRDMPGQRASEEVFAALCDLAGLDPTTAGPVREVKFSALETLRAATIFDSLGAFQHTLAVLSAGVKQNNDPVVLRMLARRSWMSGRPGDNLAFIPQVDLTRGGTPSEVLIYRSLSLIDLNRKGEVQPIIDALVSRQGDFRALAWHKPLAMLASDKDASPVEAAAVYEEALKVGKGDPALLTMHGESLQRLGRFGEARKAWEGACSSSLSLGWIRPWLNRANLALAQGKPITAVEAAQAATRIAPRSMATYATFFRAQAALLETGFQNAGSPAELLGIADRVDAELALNTPSDEIKSFRELVLPGRILLTSLVKGNDAAKQLFEKAQQDMGSLDKDTYAQIFQTSSRRSIGLETDVLPQWEKVEGLTPRVGLAKAFDMRAKGDDAGARAMLNQKASTPIDPAKPLDALAWRQSFAQFLSALNDPAAKQAWAASADFAPENLDAQLAAVTAPSVGFDLALVTRLLERIALLSKYAPDRLPPQLRMAKARALLSDPITPDNRRAANELLRQVLSDEGDFVDAQMLLVRSLMLDVPESGIRPLRTEAIAAINALLPSVPDQDRWILEQAKLYRAEGDLRNAASIFDRIANSDTAPIAMRVEAVDQMVGVREFEAAARTLESIRSKVPAEVLTPVNLKLAEVYKALKRDRSARELFAAIDPAKLDRADYCIGLAEGLAGYGDTAGVEKALARLETLDIAIETRLIARARFLARINKGDEAIALLREATTKAPKAPEAWTSLASLLLELGKLDEARAVITQAKAALPSDARIASLDRQFAAGGEAGISANMPLEDLARVLEQSPETKQRGEGVRLLASVQKAGELSNTERIAELSNRFRGDPALMTLLARTLSNDNPPRLDLAANVIRDAMDRHPSSTEAAVFATNLFRRMNNWNEALRCATAWQQLDRSIQADIVVAETRLMMNQPEGVAQMLEPRVPTAKQTADQPFSVAVLALYGRALVMTNKADQASQELGTLLQVSEGIRNQFWLAAAGQLVKPEAKVREWIDKVKPLMNGASEDDQLALAGAYANAASRFPTSAGPFNDEAMIVLRKVTSRADASARAWEALGSLQQVSGKPEAQDSFRKALEKDAKSLFALRGLASISTSPDEAVLLTKQALDVTGPSDPISQVQYGQALAAQVRQGTEMSMKRERAALSASALIAGGADRPGNMQATLTLIEVLDIQGKVSETLPLYDQLLDDRNLSANLRPVLQNNLADSIVRAGRVGVDLDRAHALVEQATTAQPNASFFDTMGMVEKARGKRDLAITAYRKAVDMDSKAYASWVSLAELLKTGTPQEQAEAKGIVDRLKQAGEAIPPALRERLMVLGQD